MKELFSVPVQKIFSNMLNLSPSFFGIRSGGLNSPGGGMTTLDFKVRRLLGDIGVRLFASFRVSAVRGLEFIINSTSVIKVLRGSSFKDKL